MKKNLIIISLIFFFLNSEKSFAQIQGCTFTDGDFSVTQPTTYLKPQKSGQSFLQSVKITLKNNSKTKKYDDITLNVTGDSHIVAIIDTPTFSNIDTSKTITFNVKFYGIIGTPSNSYLMTPTFYWDYAGTSDYIQGCTIYVIIDDTPPTQPVLSLSSVSSNSIGVSWTSSTDWPSSLYPLALAQGISNYTVVCSDGTKQTIDPINNSYKCSYLTGNTKYNIYVTATDLAGNTSTSKTINQLTFPSAPTNLNATNITYTSCTLTWTAPVGGAPDYNVYNGTTQLNTSPITTTSYTITNLCPGIQYTFYVEAYNSAGKSAKATTTKTTPSFSITGPATVCPAGGGTNFSINNLPSGYTVSWTYSTNLKGVYGGINFVSLIPNGTGTGWVQAVVNVPGCGTTPLQIPVWVGLPDNFPGNFVINGNLSLGIGTENHYSVQSSLIPAGRTSFDWSLTGPFVFTRSHFNLADCFVTPSSSAIKGSSGFLNFIVTNTCGSRTFTSDPLVVIGTAGQKSGEISATISGFSASNIEVYPNPVDDILYVKLPAEPINATANIYNVDGRLVLTQILNTQEISINVKALSKGIYFLRLSNINSVTSLRFIKQ